MTATRIPWCDETWGLWDGCSWASTGCDNCWAKRALARTQRQRAFAAGRPKLGGFEVTDHPARLLEPARWRRPRLVFVCPCGDFFHPKAHDVWRRVAWAVMCAVPRHTYLLLTKRPEQIPAWMKQEPWPDHIWLGVSVENADNLWRIGEAWRVPAQHRFVSWEPLLGPIIGALGEAPRRFPRDFHWSIIGAESGPGRRACHLQWVRDLVAAAQAASVPTFVKQLDVDGRLSKKAEEWPADLRVQQFPAGMPLPKRKEKAG